jgi:hypothetical protein
MKLLPPMVLLAIMIAVSGCPGPAATKTDNLTPHAQRSTVGVVAKPSGKGTGGGTGGTGGGPGGTGPTGLSASGKRPTLRPAASGDPNRPDVSLEAGDSSLSLGVENVGVWGQGPYLVRPRATLAAGAVGKALIVAEGEHRPSLEVYNPDVSGDFSLDTRLDLENPNGVLSHDHGGGLMWMTSGVYKNELWTAGGNDGQLQANGQAGMTPLNLYREVEGFTRRRVTGEGARTLKAPTRAAAGGVIGSIFYVAGGVFKDTAIPIPSANGGGNQIPTTRNELQAANLESFADTVFKAPMPIGVASGASAVCNGHLYVLGGYNFDASGAPVTLKTVQDYDPAADKWVKSGDTGAVVPELPVELHSAAATAVGNQLFVVGGIGADGKVRNSFYVYDVTDPRTPKAWREQPAMPTARAMLALVPFQDGLWAIGGIGADGQALRTVEKYFMGIGSP